MSKTNVIMRSTDASVNRKNLQEAVDGGAIILPGKLDENGDPEMYYAVTEIEVKASQA
jgi:hypothetical protein